MAGAGSRLQWRAGSGAGAAAQGRGRRIACDKRCAEIEALRLQKERNLALASALDIKDANVSGQGREEYSSELLSAARGRPELVAMLESKIGAFVAGLSTGQPTKCLPLPVMRRPDRAVAHELAEHYGLRSESQDAEPKRNVVIFRIKGLQPRIPTPLLSRCLSSRAAPRTPWTK